jgi:hypothetical protein
MGTICPSHVTLHSLLLSTFKVSSATFIYVTLYCFSVPDSLYLASVSDSDVFKAIKRVGPSKSVGIDKIPAFIVNGCSEIFIPFLKFIFNLSLSERSFPTLWKQAAVIAVLKKANGASVYNYRPISILNAFSKIFEFVIQEHVSYCFKSKLNPSQHGFMKSKSTATNRVCYLDAIVPLVDSQRQADSIYFDFSNAFDRVPHELLLRKLNDCGLSAGYVSWFRSYLTNRTSYVRYCGAHSSSYEVLSGVPQGSVLGPLLFNIFINDLCGVVKYSNCLLFADEIKIFPEIKSPHDSFLLHSDINPLKTKRISFI